MDNAEPNYVIQQVVPYGLIMIERGQQLWSGKSGLECFGASVYNTLTKTSAERTRLKRAVLVGGHLARLAIPKDCEHGRRRGEDVAALLFFVGLPILKDP